MGFKVLVSSFDQGYGAEFKFSVYTPNIITPEFMAAFRIHDCGVELIREQLEFSGVIVRYAYPKCMGDDIRVYAEFKSDSGFDTSCSYCTYIFDLGHPDFHREFVRETKFKNGAEISTAYRYDQQPVVLDHIDLMVSGQSFDEFINKFDLQES